jgi:DNA-binding IclR family transcriptional regulator
MTLTTDRRTDKSNFNIAQRVFDQLGEATEMLTVEALGAALRIDLVTVTGALRRLRKLHCLRSTCEDGDWRYGLRVGAERPLDRRGRPRRFASP